MLSDYGKNHQNKINKLIHWVGVTLIFFSIVAMLRSVPFPPETSSRREDNDRGCPAGQLGPIEFGHGLTDETSRLPTTGPVWGSLCHVDVFARSTCSASLIPTETSPPSNPSSEVNALRWMSA